MDQDEKNAKALAKVTRATIEVSASPKFALLSGILAALRHNIMYNYPYAYTDGINTGWNADWVLSLMPREINYVLVHEAGHCFYQHMATTLRLKAIDPMRCAHAVDHVVNNFIEDADPEHSVTMMPTLNGVQMGVFDRKYAGMSSYEVFKLLPKGNKSAGGGFDHHDDGRPLTPEEQKEIDIAKAVGERRAAAVQSRTLQDVEKPPERNWTEKFINWLFSRGRGNNLSTWRSPNRRMLYRGIYMPSRIGKSLRKAVFAPDTSGSIQGEELAQAINICKEIVKQLGCDELHIIYWDDGVRNHETYKFATGQQLSRTQPAGGGGTSFAPVLEYMEAHDIKPDVMVVTTDGYVSDYGKKPDFPVLFAVSTDQTPPWGELLRV